MYRYELHMHTKEGSACAVSSVEDMIKQYVKIGFSGAVVTNHFIRGNTCVSRSLPWEQLIMQYSKAYTNGRKKSPKNLILTCFSALKKATVTARNF